MLRRHVAVVTSLTILFSAGLLPLRPPIASAQSQAGGGDLARENAELKEKVKELQAYADELEKKLAARSRDGGSSPRVSPRTVPPATRPFGNTRPLPPAAPRVVPPGTRPLQPGSPAWPFHFDTPFQPYPKVPFRDPEYRFRIPLPQTPSTPPGTPYLLPSVPRDQTPKDWQPREFNGQPYYVIPLE